MELAAMFWVVVPTFSSLMSIPSTSIRAVRPARPPIEIDEKPFFVGSNPDPSSICTPGSSRDNTLYCGLLRVNCDGSALHFDDLSSLTKLQLDISGGDRTYLDRHREFAGSEPACLNADF